MRPEKIVHMGIYIIGAALCGYIFSLVDAEVPTTTNEHGQELVDPSPEQIMVVLPALVATVWGSVATLRGLTGSWK